MAYIREDKSKGIKESYTPDYQDKIKIDPFIPEIIPGLNEPQINSDISIET